MTDKRKRDFQQSWQDGRDWLEYCEEENTMCCKAYRLYPRDDKDRAKASFFFLFCVIYAWTSKFPGGLVKFRIN